MRSYYKPGTWNAVCDVCGFHFKADELKKRYDGRMVCDADFELRHPSELLRARQDNPPIPWSRPAPADPVSGLLTIADDFIIAEDGTYLDW
jgi:hypothetical protein